MSCTLVSLGSAIYSPSSPSACPRSKKTLNMWTRTRRSTTVSVYRAAVPHCDSFRPFRRRPCPTWAERRLVRDGAGDAPSSLPYPSLISLFFHVLPPPARSVFPVGETPTRSLDNSLASKRQLPMRGSSRLSVPTHEVYCFGEGCAIFCLRIEWLYFIWI